MTRAAVRASAAGMLSFALVATASTQSLEPAPTAASAPAGTVVAATAVASGTVATAPRPAGDGEPLPSWTLATLPDDPVAFHGLVNMDNAGLGSGTMLYPTGGLGLVGLLVGVATHAAIVGGSRSGQESAMQRSADKVIEPYHDSLARFHALELERRALALTPTAAVAHLRDAKDAPAGEAFVLAVPEFAMTADSAALVLDETIVLRPSAGSDKGVQQVVRVISPPRVEENLRDAWSADDGAALKATAAALMAESLDVALRQSRHPADDKAAFRTLRYRFGDSERMERAQLLEETCDHLVMRTLRGALLVVPHKANAALPAGCPAAPVVAERRPAAVPVPVPAGAASGVASAAS
jgi:hypothetical protein